MVFRFCSVAEVFYSSRVSGWTAESTLDMQQGQLISRRPISCTDCPCRHACIPQTERLANCVGSPVPVYIDILETGACQNVLVCHAALSNPFRPGHLALLVPAIGTISYSDVMVLPANGTPSCQELTCISQCAAPHASAHRNFAMSPCAVAASPPRRACCTAGPQFGTTAASDSQPLPPGPSRTQ